MAPVNHIIGRVFLGLNIQFQLHNKLPLFCGMKISLCLFCQIRHIHLDSLILEDKLRLQVVGFFFFMFDQASQPSF